MTMTTPHHTPNTTPADNVGLTTRDERWTITAVTPVPNYAGDYLITVRDNTSTLHTLHTARDRNAARRAARRAVPGAATAKEYTSGRADGGGRILVTYYITSTDTADAPTADAAPLTYAVQVSPHNPDAAPLTYLDPHAVTYVHTDATAPRNPYANGYGPKIPTGYRLTLADGRTRRVYAMSYGNAASFYVIVSGTTAHLNGEVEAHLRAPGPYVSAGTDKYGDRLMRRVPELARDANGDTLHIAVCSDCLMVHANGESEGMSPDAPTPWGLWNDTPLAYQPTPDYDAETGDGVAGFSHSPCEACGCTLGGDRYDFAVWLIPADVQHALDSEVR